MLQVLSEEPTAHRLQVGSAVVIGNATDCEACISGLGVAPHHARLEATPAGLTIEVLSAEARTWLNGAPVMPLAVRRLNHLDTLVLGEVLVFVQERYLSVRHHWTPGAFILRLDEECFRGIAENRNFIMLWLSVEDSKDLLQTVEMVLTSMRTFDVTASMGPSEFAILPLSATEAHAAVISARLAQRLKEIDVKVRAGVAQFRTDGNSALELLAVARRRAHFGALPRSELPDPIVPHVSAAVTAKQLAARVAASELSVLILGETGVGKDHLARQIHTDSPRALKRYLKINCAALPEQLLESELFGYERGAFTGADKAKVGLLEACQGGTLLLDEIGEIPMSTQAKLLSALEDREVMPIGGTKARPIDVRFLAATNRDLEEATRRGTFRLDLFFRLNGITLRVPPLRERVGEIRALAESFIAELWTPEPGKPGPRLTAEALQVLEGHRWPGNIRELRTTIRRALVLAPGDELRPEHMQLGEGSSDAPAEQGSPTAKAAIASERASPSNSPQPPPPDQPQQPPPRARSLAEVEREEILRVLADCAGNQSEAARRLGMARRTLVSRLDEYGVPRPRRRGDPTD